MQGGKSLLNFNSLLNLTTGGFSPRFVKTAKWWDNLAQTLTPKNLEDLLSSFNSFYPIKATSLDLKMYEVDPIVHVILEDGLTSLVTQNVGV